MIMTRGFVRFLPDAWNTKANRKGHEWHDEKSAFVLCELDLWRRQPTFVMIESGSPTKWRDELWAMSEACAVQDAAAQEQATKRMDARLFSQRSHVFTGR